jgi:hypothetical protein
MCATDDLVNDGITAHMCIITLPISCDYHIVQISDLHFLFLLLPPAADQTLILTCCATFENTSIISKFENPT